MRVKIDTDKIEQLLSAHWTEFLDARDLRSVCAATAAKYHNMSPDCKVKQLSISRFEFLPQPSNKHFVIWLEVTISEANKEIKATLEFLLSLNGDFVYTNSALNDI
jgi:hypothetical protein